MQEVSGSIPLGSTTFDIRPSKVLQLEVFRASPSSRGLGHHPFTVATGVRIPVGTPVSKRTLLPADHPEFNGAIAQLGERLHGMQEVSGSIPLGSTTFDIRPSKVLQLEVFRASPSSRGLGHHPFTVATGVRIPVGTPILENPGLGRGFSLPAIYGKAPSTHGVDLPGRCSRSTPCVDGLTAITPQNRRYIPIDAGAVGAKPN